MSEAGVQLLGGFHGTEIPASVAVMLSDDPVAGFTLFRDANVRSAAQVAELCESLQDANSHELPLLIAADQETGQLLALGPDTTPFPGNMALGATEDLDLARRVGRAVGTEMAAMGVNVDYAPVCDVATLPSNPSLGVRAFGDDPRAVGDLAAATVRGLAEAGVLAVAKHFPGKGEAATDPHHGLPVLDLDRHRLDEIELVPFRRVIEEGVRMVMVGHYAIPSITGRPDLPSSLAVAVVDGLLRNDLSFDGVAVTDALDMGALDGRRDHVSQALAAGVDLLLCSVDESAVAGIRASVERALPNLDPRRIALSRARVERLRRSLPTGPGPDLDVVGCTDHQALALEVALRATTVVRDDAGLLPLRPSADAAILAVMPKPSDLTPADTSSLVTPGLAGALRRHHPRVTEVVTSPTPTPNETAAVLAQARRHDLVVIGTINAGTEQVAIVEAVLEAGLPCVTVALRVPTDLAAYPTAPTHLCTYSILPPAMKALAAVLFGLHPSLGRLPMAIAGLYPRGHRA